MAYKLTVHEDALMELEDAINWYSKISVELSEDFGKKFIEALDSVEENPALYPVLNGGFRKLNLERFPYKLVYKVFPSEILIVAVAHHKRHQSYWAKRLPS